MKVRPIRFNALKKGTSKPGLHKPKDRHRSKVSKEVNIGDNGFKDLSFWESIEGGLHISEDKPCEPIEF